jgi:hypothetical protein
MENLRDSAAGGMAVAWASIITFVPKFLVFLAIVIGGYFLAKFLARLFNSLLERLKFDNLVERGGVKRVLARSGYDASDVLAKLLFYTLFLFVLQFAFGIFGPNPISDLLTRIIAYIPSIFVAAIIIIVAAAIAKGVKDILSVGLGGLSYGQMLAKVAAGLIIVLGIFAALDQLGIAPNIVRGIFYASLAIVAGSAIVAIGGGGIRPMQSRWERVLGRVESEAPRLKTEAAHTREAARQKTGEWKQRAEGWTNQPQERAQSAELRPHGDQI